MPIYEFSCEKCDKVSEMMFGINDFPETITCQCGEKAKKILSTHGSVLTDGDVTWMPSASDALVKHHEPPVTTRTEYRRYLKENKLVPIG